MTLTITSLLWGLGWLLGVQELPFVEISKLPAEHVVTAGKDKVPLGNWLLSIERQLNAGKGDGRLSKGEFLLARAMPKWRHLKRFETFDALATFVKRSLALGRCHKKKRKQCPPWETLPNYHKTLRGRTQTKKHLPRFHYSRYTRLCRKMASLRNVQRPSSAQRSRTNARLQEQKKRALAIIKFVRTLPKFKKKSEWVAWVKQQWRNPAYLAKVRTALGFVPKKRQVLSLLKLIKVGKKPGPRDIMRLARLAMRVPLGSLTLYSALSGWMIWGGDPRKRSVRWKVWKRFFRHASPSCQSTHRKVMSGTFLCGTTLAGAMEVMSKSPFLNYFVRGIIKPWRAHTLDESLRSCLAERLGPWMTYGYGKRCIPQAKKDKLFKVLARTTMRRYEPYASARKKALRSLAQWRPKQAIPCLLMALHPTREPKSYVREAAVQGLMQIGLRLPRQRRLIKKYLWHSTDRTFDPKLHDHALEAGMQLGEHRTIPGFLAKLTIKPHRCRPLRRRRYGATYKLVPSHLGIPSSYWSVLADDFLVSRRTRKQRNTMYRLAQCGDAPLGYVQRTIRFLQPKAEPDPKLRIALWRALLYRYLHFYRGTVSVTRLHKQQQRWYRNIIELRTTGRSHKRLLLRLLLVSLEQVGLKANVETNPRVQDFAMIVALALRHPAAFRMFANAAKQRHFKLSPAVHRAVFLKAALFPYAHRYHFDRRQKPNLVFHPAKKQDFAYLTPTQQRGARTFFRQWIQASPPAKVRAQIERLVRNTIGW